jgi:hypothetical protein
MKISKSRLKEIIQEELEMCEGCGDEDMMGPVSDPEYDQEGYMTKSALYKTAEYAMELHDMIGDDDNLPEWMQFKIAKISQMIGDVKHALEYDQEYGDYDDHQEQSDVVYDEMEQGMEEY